ncbi:hypothetical protein [Duganella phyllosphaerae]|uniref:hypothetical protein n=1 Tax=Duganella phyllosphaerae TaxID=762836 RepID=UPI00114D0E94|nr:hypothetical protein [Duganella phyllosphaerae]
MAKFRLLREARSTTRRRRRAESGQDGAQRSNPTLDGRRLLGSRLLRPVIALLHPPLGIEVWARINRDFEFDLRLSGLACPLFWRRQFAHLVVRGSVFLHALPFDVVPEEFGLKLECGPPMDKLESAQMLSLVMEKAAL